MERICKSCNGTGKSWGKDCDDCGGLGTTYPGSSSDSGTKKDSTRKRKTFYNKKATDIGMSDQDYEQFVGDSSNSMDEESTCV